VTAVHVAAADDAQLQRCTQGITFATAAKPDLPRAALYLEGCDKLALDEALAATVSRTRADVAAKLEKSTLSALAIVTTPEGLVAETDAMPGERFTTPATIWTKAGDYRVNVAPDAATLDANKGMTTLASIEAFSRRTVIINLPQKKQTQPKDGKVDFSDEAPETGAHQGPPKEQKFGSILPKKYRKPSGESNGPQLDDPLALRADSSLAWRFGARFGGGIAMADSTTSAFGVAILAARGVGGPISLGARLAWSHRKVDAGVLEVGLGVRVAESSAVTLTVGAGVRGEVRLQTELAMEEVARVGIGGALGLDLAIRSLPIVVGLRIEPAFTELVPGVRAHALMLELGYDWR
jgi:hypothetical protein